MRLTIGEKIALLRRERGITQTELAEYLFLTPQTVSRWEAGGAPEITLLPKIAAFFGVSIDELFGVTDLERAEDLVCKYSVLRDDRSFQEAMDCLNSQLQTVDAMLREGAEDAGELGAARDKLEAEKTHMWIQQGREAFRRAYAMADAIVERTEGQPEHPWYLPMRLQRNQLAIHMGKGREALAACEKDFAERPGGMTLRLYFSLLNDLHRCEEILALQETDGRVRALTLPPSKENLDAWWHLIHAAAETGGVDFVERYLPPVLEICGEREEYDFLLCLLELYRGEELARIQRRLLALLPGMSLNKYFEEKALQRIKEAGQQASPPQKADAPLL